MQKEVLKGRAGSYTPDLLKKLVMSLIPVGVDGSVQIDVEAFLSHFIRRHWNSSSALFSAASIPTAPAISTASAAFGIAASHQLSASASGFLVSLEAGLSAVAGCPRISSGLISTQGAVAAARAAIVFRKASSRVRCTIGRLGSRGPISGGRVGGPIAATGLAG